jgi:hypothetical protein
MFCRLLTHHAWDCDPAVPGSKDGGVTWLRFQLSCPLSSVYTLYIAAFAFKLISSVTALECKGLSEVWQRCRIWATFGRVETLFFWILTRFWKLLETLWRNVQNLVNNSHFQKPFNMGNSSFRRLFYGCMSSFLHPLNQFGSSLRTAGFSGKLA